MLINNLILFDCYFTISKLIGLCQKVCCSFKKSYLIFFRFNRSNIGTTLSSFHALERHNEEFLKGAVATLGPISVGIYASGNLMHYKGGVFVDDACLSHHYLNHGVLLVGYGVDPKTREEYWLVKNSWGHHWGEHGYVRLARNRHNMCGISTSPSIPVI